MSQDTNSPQREQSPTPSEGGATGERRGVGVDWVRNNQEPREQSKG
ncbi:hypothetical protein MW652_001135 [Vibrio vulnificus]|nr:hypothetical protein [Vibrio vulnificus]EJB5282214.1 hypothetical protein [Vibrio vulnificus]